jgi:hypothetical protein
MTLNITTKAQPDATQERETAFTIDDREYTVPVEVDSSVGMMATDLMATQGEPAAVRYIMIQLLGKDAYQRLIREKGLSREDLKAIQIILREKVFGAEEDQGNG